jgi:hypothetical protein
VLTKWIRDNKVSEVGKLAVCMCQLIAELSKNEAVQQ